ncbi:DMT family transporter [Pseudomonas viridiflava]|uniref:DMT family transporter n=1 Tax=Pseudomonas viridiflava TaxID=33069 RepID=UPI001F14F129|nr:DMT family transporter [Pseudomonas viridiflava]
MNGQTVEMSTQTSQQQVRPVSGSRWVSVLLLAAMVLSWSSGFIGYRYASEHSGVMLVTFWRFVLMALLLCPLVLGSLRQLNWHVVRQQMLVGLFGIAGFISAIALSIELGVAPGTSSLIANLLPLSIVLSAGLIPGQRTRGRQWVGVALCIAGMLIASAASIELSSAPAWAYGLPALAVLSLTAATIYQKKSAAVPVPAFTALFIQAVATLPVFAALAMWEGSIVPVMVSDFGLAVLWLVIFATLGGYGFYWLCVQRFNVQTVSGALFLTPPATMLWAFLQFDDPLHGAALLGVALTLIGLPFLRRR